MNSTRRKFLGLLAAAPVAGPLLAQQAASPRYFSGGIVGLGGPELIVGEACVGDFMTPQQLQMLKCGFDVTPRPNEALRRLLHSSSPWGAPNRLYGAQIKDDGDAV